ncbi:MAG: mannitol dehydrogenase family protein [Pseudomonadota bacterium]
MDELIPLSAATLHTLDPRITVPTYDRSAVRPGILHVGLGNFHRAHQALYLDDLMTRGEGLDWGILGAGVMPGDARMRADLEAQDWLFTVLEQDADTEAARISGAMTGFVPVTPDHEAIRAALRDPAIRILSLTVTEGGYFLDAAGSPDLDHAALRADIAAPDQPGTVFGAIVAGLRDRRAAGAAPFTVMCCDNLPHNGSVTRRLVAGIAREQDAGLGDWIDAEVAFPNSMVDRITPATTPARAALLSDSYGLQDTRPVFCEPFRQWVLEDHFTDGRPPLEQVGVEFVTDVAPFETMKIRILNGGHAIIAYPSSLLGIEYAHEAMAHPLVSAFFDKVEREEVLPVVPDVPGTSTSDYLTLIRRRFANPRVEDTTDRICFDGSNRQPKFIVPSVRDNLARGGPVAGLALASALWCRYCMGHNEAGQPIAPNDPDWDNLTMRANRAREDPEIWLSMDDVYGDVAEDVRFGSAFADALEQLITKGTAATLKTYLS